MKHFLRIVFTCLLAICSIGALAQIAFDAASSAKVDTGISVLTLPHTCSGNNRVLVVGIITGQGTGWQIASVTYNGFSLTPVVRDSFPANASYISAWVLSNPSLGTNNIVISFANRPKYVVAGGVSFTNANTSSPIGATASSVSLVHMNQTLSTTSDNSMILDFAGTPSCSATTTITADSAQSIRWIFNAISSPPEAASTTRPTTNAGSYTMRQHGYCSASNSLIGAALEIREHSTTGPTAVSRITPADHPLLAPNPANGSSCLRLPRRMSAGRLLIYSLTGDLVSAVDVRETDLIPVGSHLGMPGWYIYALTDLQSGKVFRAAFPFR